MISRYAELTPEQKRRKQAIRNWRKLQKELVEYCKFATICQHVYIKDEKSRVDTEMKQSYENLCYSFKCIFENE